MTKIPAHNHAIIRAEVKKPIINVAGIIYWTKDLIKDIGMELSETSSGNPIAAYIDDENNRGVTCAALIKTSHIAVHIWDEPDPALVQLDVYTCSELPMKKVEESLQIMKPQKIEYKVFNRMSVLHEVKKDFILNLKSGLGLL